MEVDSNLNITLIELFNFEIDKSIETGDIIFIQLAIKKYQNLNMIIKLLKNLTYISVIIKF
jgi:hypothetical protein